MATLANLKCKMTSLDLLLVSLSYSTLLFSQSMSHGHNVGAVVP